MAPRLAAAPGNATSSSCRWLRNSSTSTPPPGTNLRPGDFISEIDLVEKDIAERQHKTMIAEFKERLEWATWKVGASLRRGVSRFVKAPPKPKEGYSLVVRPLTPGVGDGYGEAFVAKPDGSRRELNSEEAYNLHRQRTRRRRKWPTAYGGEFPRR